MKMDIQTISASKLALRKQIRAQLSHISEADRRLKSAVITNAILSSPQYVSANCISIFLSTCTEVDTIPILNAALDCGKRVFIPRFLPKSHYLEMVRLISMDDYKELPEIMWGIKQPHMDEKRQDCFEDGGLDLVICPGCAFTVSGKRLGHGAGYYDNFLMRYKDKFGRLPYLIGVCFREQLVDDLPVTERDINMNEVVSG